MSNGALFVPTLNRLGTDLSLIINNYNRPHYQVRDQDVLYKIKIFSDGKLITEEQAELIKTGQFLHFNFNNLFKLDKNREYLFCVDFDLEKNPELSFIREHQVIYRNKSGKFGTVIFENLPKASKSPSAIICIAHKCFVSDEINTIISLGIREGSGSDISTEALLEYVLLDEKGNQVAKNNVKIATNSTHYINVKEELKYLGRDDGKMQFYNLCLRLQNARCILYATILNEKTDNLAIEHSLPPLYYTDSKDLATIRKTAISNLF